MPEPQPPKSLSDKKELPLYLPRLYKATDVGFRAYKQDLVLAPSIGYDLVDTLALGEKHFAATFRLRDEHVGKTKAEYDSFFDEQDLG